MTNSTTRDEFEAWCSQRWRGDRGAFVRKHDDSGYIMERLDFALDAYLAARRAALLEAAKVCEKIEVPGWSSARCVDALRALADEGMKD